MKMKFAFLFSTLVNLCFAQSADSIKVVLREGTNLAVALSPDKQTLALDLQGTLWILPVTGGVAKPITDNLGDCRQPSWSPDGNDIVFQSYRDGGWHIWKINKDGSNLTQLTFGIYDDREPQWSADGKRILFSSDRNMNYDVWELTLETGNLKALTTHVKNDFYPAYAPDGKSFTFISERNEKPSIFTQSLETEDAMVAAESPATPAAPVWSPDGKSIMFSSSDRGDAKLVQVNISDKKITNFTLPTEDAFPFRATWLSNNEVIYTADGQIKKKNILKNITSTINFEASVYLHRPPYTRKQYNFNETKPQQVKGIMAPAVSPNGKQIVFSALSNLWLINTGTAAPQQITTGSFVNMQPAWSPDGKQLVFVSDREGGSMDLWLKNLSDNSEKILTQLSGNEEMPMWSPDGKSVLFLHNGFNGLLGGNQLSIINVESGEIKKIHAPIVNPSQPSWSADGKRIVLSSLVVFSSRFREGLSKFQIISLDGSADKFWLPVEGKGIATRNKNGPIWSPDGSMMAYTQDGVLWIVPVTPSGEQAGPPQRLTNELSENPTWTADSKSIVFLATDKIKKIKLSDGSIETIPLNLNWQSWQPAMSTTIIHGARVFDGKNNTYRTNVDVIVEGNRIKEIAQHKEHTSSNVIDATGKTLMPGLFEMHAHQNESAGERLGRTWLAYGITTVREPGADPYEATARQEIWSSGARPGPRLFYTGALQDGNRIFYGLANTATGANTELELNRAKTLGFDFMKTYVRMPDYLQKRITAFAHENGIPVSSHEIYPSVSYGVDNIEHIGATSRRGYSLVRSNIGRTYQDVHELANKSKLKITPTAALVGGFGTLTFKDPTLLKNMQYVSLYSEEYRQTYDAALKQQYAQIEPTKKFVSNIQKAIVRLVAEGNHITSGTDTPLMPFGISLHLELQTYVDGGLSPFHALQSATLWAAESLAVDKDLGSIESGKLADLVIVDGDPLKNIRDAWNVKWVMKSGKVYSIEELLKVPEGK